LRTSTELITGPTDFDFGSSTNGSIRHLEKKTDLKPKVITIEIARSHWRASSEAAGD